MRPLEELVDLSQPGLEVVRAWVAEAVRTVEVLTCSPEAGRDSLMSLQVTTRSPMGALAYESGGMLVDDGWLRVLGAPCDRLPRGIADWNQMTGEQRLPGALLIGDDLVGGFFAINAGRFDGPEGNVFYLAPDTLEWEDLATGYSGWLVWLLQGDVDAFYDSFRWPGWREDARVVAGDQAFSIHPFPFAEGPPVAERSRRAVPIEELWNLYAVEFPTQLSR